MKKQTKTINQPWQRGLVILSVLMFVALCINGGATIYLLRQNKNHSDGKIAGLILRAVDSLNQPLVINPLTGNEYIPAAKLVWPATNANLGSVVYNYNPGDGTLATQQVELASLSDIRVAEGPLLNTQDTTKIFAAVPKLQACSRGVTITFAPQQGQKLAATKTLSNGRQVYFYTESACSNPQLLSYAKQVDSY